MKQFLFAACSLLAFSLAAVDADAARRLGGGGNVGAQRSITPQQPAKPPAQQAQQAPQQAQPPAAAPQPQASGMSRWLGPLAGLAIGAGLASLFMNNGLAGALGGLLMIGLLAAAALFAWRMLRSRPAARDLQYAGAAPAPAAPRDLTPAPSPAPAGGGMPRIGSALGSAPAPAAENSAAPAASFPPGFDAVEFARHARKNFTRLQEANDKRDLSLMRDYMTPALYAEIAAGIDPMGPLQQTEIVSLDAQVVEVVTEGDRHIASVRFNGALRERSAPEVETFDEVWHLEKPLDGASGWLVAGIQQA